MFKPHLFALAAALILAGCASSGGSPGGMPGGVPGGDGAGLPSPAPGGGAGAGLPSPTATPSPAPTVGTGSGAPSAPSAGTSGSNPTASGAPHDESANGDGQGRGPAVNGSAQTDEERRTQRTAQMDDSLGRFDEMIRNEREQIARDRDARSGSGTGDGSGEGAGEGADEGNAQDGEMKSDDGEEKPADGSASEPGAENSKGDMKSEGGSGSGIGKGKGPSDPSIGDVGDGSDDDVIARQIREAAEKETDPELRDKLWKEYIEYKKNAKKK